MVLDRFCVIPPGSRSVPRSSPKQKTLYSLPWHVSIGLAPKFENFPSPKNSLKTPNLASVCGGTWARLWWPISVPKFSPTLSQARRYARIWNWLPLDDRSDFRLIGDIQVCLITIGSISISKEIRGGSCQLGIRALCLISFGFPYFHCAFLRLTIFLFSIFARIMPPRRGRPTNYFRGLWRLAPLSPRLPSSPSSLPRPPLLVEEEADKNALDFLQVLE